MSESLRSADLCARALQFIPGGVNSSLRVMSPPLAFTRAFGSKIYDADGREYIDHHLAFGPIILGHCHPHVNRKVSDALGMLDLVGAGATPLEIDLSAKLVQHVPSGQLVAFCNSGTEATYHAIRLARGITGRRYIVKFQGCYHGWHDSVLVNFITPAERLGSLDPGSAGMVRQAFESTIVLRFNDIEGVEQVFRSRGEEIAAVIVEPVAHNVGCIMPAPEFLASLRNFTQRWGTVLIFDEIITGFRHHIGGYQAVCGITPDLTTVGKAIANGYPLAAIAGRRDVMSHFSTAGGDVAYAGTYNGHAAAMAAGLATLQILENGDTYRELFAAGDRLRAGLADLAADLAVPAHVAGFGSIWVVYFLQPPVQSYNDLLRNDTTMDIAFRRELISRGVFCLPSALKRNHLSASHTAADIDKTLEVAEAAFRAVRALRSKDSVRT